MLKSIKVRTVDRMVYRKVIIAGKLKYVTIQATGSRPKGGRIKKHQPTNAAVERINQKNAERNLSILMNHNFADGDYHLVLTYETEPSTEDARKEIDRYLRRLRDLYKKHGKELKWISATEYLNKRIHHHLIVNRLDLELVRAKWTAGNTFYTHLNTEGDYRKLAAYFIKETSSLFREENASDRCRYRHSRTVVYPVETIEEVSAENLFKEPKPTKGFYIDRDTLVQTVHPYTGMPYVSYVEIADIKPKYKVWPRGKRRAYKPEYFKILEPEEQIKLKLE